MEDLALYKSMIDRKAEEESSEVLPNAGESHASIVMSKMFEKTQVSVNMIVGSLDIPVCNQENYYTQLKNCIDRNVNLRIIFLDNPNINSKSYQLLKSKQLEGYNNIIMKSASNNVRRRLTKSDTPDAPIHFSVFDDNKYRYEKDSKQFLAWVCFNDKKNAGALLAIFNEFFVDSTAI